MKRLRYVLVALLVAIGLTIAVTAPAFGATPVGAVRLDTANPCGGSAYACANGTAVFIAGANTCTFSGNAPSLGICANADTSFLNWGKPCSGCDWIRVYWGYNYSGAYVCVPPGYGYGTGSAPHMTFNRGSGLNGYGASVWNNAASMQWTGAC